MHTHNSFSQSFRTFAYQHDDLPAFHAAFLVGTFFAAAVLNLGFFACLIAIHMCMDTVKYREIHGYNWARTIHAACIESLTDIMFFFIALTSTIYLHHSYALSFISGLTRAELTVASIFAVLLPKMQILEHMLHVYTHINSYMHTKQASLQKGLTVMQIICVTVTVAAIVLLMLSPMLFHGSEHQLALLLNNELVPWKL